MTTTGPERLSGLIARLQAVHEEHGDIEVFNDNHEGPLELEVCDHFDEDSPAGKRLCIGRA